MTRHRCYHWVNINVPEYKIHFQKRTWPLSGAAADARRGAVGRPAAGHLLLRREALPVRVGRRVAHVRRDLVPDLVAAPALAREHLRRAKEREEEEMWRW